MLEMRDVKLGENGSCKPWSKLQNVLLYVTLGSPLLVAIINLGTELLITIGSDFTRPINQQTNVIEIAYGIMWIQIINLGLLFLVINLNYDLGIWEQ